MANVGTSPVCAYISDSLGRERLDPLRLFWGRLAPPWSLVVAN
jgi:hypothetical protein